jgi:hypothetical protein
MADPILNQLARTTLLPDEIANAILVGETPALKEVVTHLLIAAMDCEGMTASDPSSSWNEKRHARQVLVLAFLSAILGINDPVRAERR